MVLNLNTLGDMNRFDKEEILNNIYDYDNHNDIVEVLLKDSDSLVRSAVAEALEDEALYINAKNALINLSSDKDSLVRTSAVESLQYYHAEDVYFHVKKKLINETDFLVKSYAVTSLTNLGLHFKKEEEVKSLFKTMLLIEKSSYCKAYFYYNLIVLGDIIYLDLLLKLLNARSYRTQIITIKFLTYLIEDKTIPENKNHIIFYAIKKREMKKNVFSVQDNIEKSLYKINELLNNKNTESESRE